MLQSRLFVPLVLLFCAHSACQAAVDVSPRGWSAAVDAERPTPAGGLGKASEKSWQPVAPVKSIHEQVIQSVIVREGANTQHGINSSTSTQEPEAASQLPLLLLVASSSFAAGWLFGSRRQSATSNLSRSEVAGQKEEAGILAGAAINGEASAKAGSGTDLAPSIGILEPGASRHVGEGQCAAHEASVDSKQHQDANDGSCAGAASGTLDAGSARQVEESAVRSTHGLAATEDTSQLVFLNEQLSVSASTHGGADRQHSSSLDTASSAVPASSAARLVATMSCTTAIVQQDGSSHHSSSEHQTEPGSPAVAPPQPLTVQPSWHAASTPPGTQAMAELMLPPPKRSQQPPQVPTSDVSAPPAASASVTAGTSGGEAAGWEEATALVGALAGQLRVDLAELSPGDKIQLITVVVNAWQAFQHRHHHADTTRLGLQALGYQAEHVGLVRAGLGAKEARAAAVAQRQGAADLLAAAADCLYLGLLLTMASTLYSGLRHGFLERRIAECPALSKSVWQASPYKPWTLLRPAQALGCWVFTTGDVIAGIAIVGLVAYAVLRSNALSGYHAMPLNKLVLGLGMVCGGAGYIAIGKMGGDAAEWLVLWEVWVALQTLLVWQTRVVYRLLHGGGAHGSSCSWTRAIASGSAKMVFVAVMGFGLPVAAGVLPFHAHPVKQWWSAGVHWLLA